MYENFYGLKEKPFQIVPNPNYLFLSSVHENAVVYLEYGLMENVGFILLTGAVGTGKTTLVRHIMDQFAEEKDIAVIFNTNVSADELICLILHACDLQPESGNKTRNIEILNQFLIEKYVQERPVLLIIDEAQNLSDAALEEVRMLSNLQTDEQSLVQIMLVGQPELKNRLMQPEHSAFAQRIAVNFILSGLTDTETAAYIRHRLEKAGGRHDTFSSDAVETIHRAAGGIPRTINFLCDAALVYGFGYEYATIDASVIEQVIRDKDGMGLSTGAESRKPAFSYCGDAHQEITVDRRQQTGDAAVGAQQRLEELAVRMEKLEKAVKSFQTALDGSLKDLLVKERNRNNKLLVTYATLKAKYDSLMNLWKFKRNAPAAEDSSVILLKQKSGGSE